MLSGLGAVWQSFLSFAVYNVLGKIRIPCPALTSLVRQRHFSKRNNCVMPEIRSYRPDTRARVAGDFRLSHRITNERSTFAVFSRLSLTRTPSPFSFLPAFPSAVQCLSMWKIVRTNGSSRFVVNIYEYHRKNTRPAKITARACSRKQLRNRRPSYLPIAVFGWHLARLWLR
jgi:hypothetical protein